MQVFNEFGDLAYVNESKICLVRECKTEARFKLTFGWIFCEVSFSSGWTVKLVVRRTWFDSLMKSEME